MDVAVSSRRSGRDAPVIGDFRELRVEFGLIAVHAKDQRHAELFELGRVVEPPVRRIFLHLGDCVRGFTSSSKRIWRATSRARERRDIRGG